MNNPNNSYNTAKVCQYTLALSRARANLCKKNDPVFYEKSDTQTPQGVHMCTYRRAYVCVDLLYAYRSAYL